jgi:hypothetical protein
MFAFIDKLFAAFVCLPPLYMIFRFVRWWIKQELKPQGSIESKNRES